LLKSKSSCNCIINFIIKNDIKNGLISCETPNTIRKDLIQKFGDKENDLQALINHQILPTGDVPE
jgi:superfamily II DNA or RNA helicase